MQRVRVQIACPNQEECKGEPVTIAFLDTGVKKHPDFADRIIAFKDFVNGKNECYDDSGHGTHVCGIAAGDGSLSDGKYSGIAPKSRIVMVKVLDKNGDGLAEQMIEGLDWVIKERAQLKIKIINISIGVGNLKDKKKQQELIRKVEEAWENGIIVVCAAGNMGPERGSISPLGISRKVITVGCHDGKLFSDNENRCETYSGRGPTRNAIKKPDLVAPGTDIISCNVHFYQTGKKTYEKVIYKNAYVAKSGTSMATPMVSGAAALLLQKNPYMTQEQIKKKILYTAMDMGEPWTKQGWGMLNIRRALG